jgi:threonine/homoserine/homoserine lactone efflux protein
VGLNYLSLILFSVATCVTPGPNNTMILASGVNYGFRRSMPHLIGINIGFPFMVVAVGLGAGGVFQRFPIVHEILKVVGVVYLLWMAWKIATAGEAGETEGRSRPLTILQAALFQWVNPKAWIMAVGAVVTYSVAGSPYWAQVLMIALVFMVFGTPCTGVWLWFGSSLRRFLATPGRRRLFNVGMALLLVASLAPIAAELWRVLAA